MSTVFKLLQIVNASFKSVPLHAACRFNNSTDPPGGSLTSCSITLVEEILLVTLDCSCVNMANMGVPSPFS